MPKITLLLILLSLASCSLGQKQNTTASSDEEIVELVEDSEFQTVTSTTLYDDTSSNDIVLEGNAQDEVISDEKDQEPFVKTDVVFDDQTSKEEIAKSLKNISYYDVKKGETLMSISYKIYGHYDKWKQINALNDNIIDRGFLLSGTQIKYVAPENLPARPLGKVYIVRDGDYLSKISAHLYDSRSKLWPWLWDNNKSNYSNPDQIFSGLPLYYLPLNNQILAQYGYKTLKDRGIASE